MRTTKPSLDAFRFTQPAGSLKTMLRQAIGDTLDAVRRLMKAGLRLADCESAEMTLEGHE